MPKGEVIAFPSAEERQKLVDDRRVREEIDHMQATALVEAGYMSLPQYIELYHPTVKSTT